MEYRYAANGDVVTVQVEAEGEAYRVTVEGETFYVKANLERPGEVALEIDGARRLAWVAADGPRRWVALGSQPYVLALPETGRRGRRAGGDGHDTLAVQMPGVVRRVLAAPGERVERGQVLVLLEAMKMEIRVAAPHAGVVAKVAVAEGQAVERGQLLVEVDSAQ